MIEKQELQGYLQEGFTLKQIGEKIGKGGSSIGRYCQEYGIILEKRNKKHLLSVEETIALIISYNTVSAAAQACGMSISGFNARIRKFSLEYLIEEKANARSRKGTPGTDPREKNLRCIIHGESNFILEGRGYYRCQKCRNGRVSKVSDANAIRHQKKIDLVKLFGGECIRCGHDTVQNLDFHHRDPTDKLFRERLQITYWFATCNYRRLARFPRRGTPSFNIAMLKQ